MAQLRQDYHQFKAKSAVVIVVGPEDARAYRAFWESKKLPFIGLPDPTTSVLKLYGQETNIFKLGRMPAQVVIDKDGIARYAHYGHNMTDIPSNNEILGILDEINATQSLVVPAP